MRQIEAVETERDAVVRCADADCCAETAASSAARADTMISTLSRLKGIGANDATLLTHEVFYRQFRNRRELAGWAGLAPTPWASGDVERDQGIGRDGPAWIRAQLLQMAWRWVRYQPDGALTRWFETRTAGAPGTDAPNHDRGTGPQAPDRPVALCRHRSRTHRRSRRLSPRP